jgi:alginate O-acetyltransferase complex protein AlgI
MLFNSFLFLLLFLPLAFGIDQAVMRWWPRGRIAVLVALSLIFYGYWDWRFVPLLVGSVLLNWLIAELFFKYHWRFIIIPAIIANLGLLGLFKYANFFAGLWPFITALPAPVFELALPLGISFFTFHHVMYLVDAKANRAPRFSLTDYSFYIVFFPQVLAGPLVRWREIMPQIQAQRPLPQKALEQKAAHKQKAFGLMLLVLGLGKKVLIGDALGEYVNPVFKAAADGAAITTGEAWQATLGFTFQIYFDFSGYTDMALGLALLFGFVLPQNFDAPYRASSLQDFWRRWHMTLSRFLRDYLYVPLGGNRFGIVRQGLALLATMILGGLWHGAGLTFLLWGAVHGLALGVGVIGQRQGFVMPRFIGWGFTFGFVMMSWVLFRASDFESAATLYKSLFGFGAAGPDFKWRMIAIAACFALIGPTSWQIVQSLKPSRLIGAAFALLAIVILLKMNDASNYEFIYFQF